MLFADQLSNTCFVLLKQLLETVHHLRTFGRRGIAPGWKGQLGRVDGLLHGFAVSKAERMDNLAGGRVVYIASTPAADDALCVNQMRDGSHCCFALVLMSRGSQALTDKVSRLYVEAGQVAKIDALQNRGSVTDHRRRDGSLFRRRTTRNRATLLPT
ncbi:hypothetical protein D3C78_1301560 [compost metagenome]